MGQWQAWEADRQIRCHVLKPREAFRCDVSAHLTTTRLSRQTIELGPLRQSVASICWVIGITCFCKGFLAACTLVVSHARYIPAHLYILRQWQWGNTFDVFRQRHPSCWLTFNIPRGVLWGPQRVIFCDPAVTISTNLLLIFVCVPHQLEINIM